MLSESTPVIVGVGEFVERAGAADYRGLSPADLAAEAVRCAIADTGVVSALGVIEAIGVVRTFEDSSTRPSAFGKPANFPRAVARRLAIDPRVAVLEKAGGQSPVVLLTELCGRIASGEFHAAVLTGAEAISTVRHLARLGETRDWGEDTGGDLEDHGAGLDGIVSRDQVRHGMVSAPSAYALLENARRARLGVSRGDYLRDMGRLFAPFTAVAARNPHAAAKVGPSTADDLTEVSEHNRMVSDPYPARLVSRDLVNQSAALVVMSVEKARALGVDESKWVFVHGCASVTERDILRRPDIGASPAAKAALETALAVAGRTVAQIAHFDFYSCFPIAVSAAAVDGLGLAADDPRGLTVTGGLPFFGGPGNNYSTHAIATMSRLLRAERGAYGLIGANGGFLSKYAGLVLSTDPVPWRDCEGVDQQEDLDEEPGASVAIWPEGGAKLLTYTIVYDRKGPIRAIVIGELDSGARFMANESGPDTLAALVADDPIGRRIWVHPSTAGNRFAFDRDVIRRTFPRPRAAFQDRYEYALVARAGHVLEVTINRPEARNALTIPAHHELAAIFDAFEHDRDLWVAIITGAGDQAFCAGVDLKGLAADRGGILPRSGFAGLANRAGRTKPVIAAVNGIAYGGGLETALACDLIVADPTARLGLTEVRVGMIAGAGGAVRLPRQLPRKIAMEMLLTGRKMDAAEAERRGLVNRIATAGGVMEEARRLAADIAAGSPTSVRLTMQLVTESDAYPGVDDATAAMPYSTAIDALMLSEDMAEGLAAFAQRRQPTWRNR